LTTEVPYWGQVPTHDDWQDLAPKRKEALDIFEEGPIGGYYSDLEIRLANELYDMIIEVEKLRSMIRALEGSLSR
jgi:hypothetical protein